MVILLILFFLVMTIIPWKTIEEQKRKEAEKNVKYVHVTEEDMPVQVQKALHLLGKTANHHGP